METIGAFRLQNYLKRLAFFVFTWSALTSVKFIFAKSDVFSSKFVVLALFSLIALEMVHMLVLAFWRGLYGLPDRWVRSNYHLPLMALASGVQLFLLKMNLLVWTSFDILFLMSFLLSGIMIFRMKKGPLFPVALIFIFLVLVVGPQAYYSYYNNVFKLDELVNFPLLFEVLPFYQTIGLYLLTGLFVLSVAKVTFTVVRSFPFHFVALSMLALISGYFMVTKFELLEKTGMDRRKIVDWSETVTSSSLGVYPSILYYELKRLHNVGQVARFKGNRFQMRETTLFESFKETPKANIHIFLAESWINFARMTGFDGLKPVDSIFNEGSLTKTRIFGGATAVAEFEVLCGVPGLGQIARIDFNAMKGYKTPCLPNILAKKGYQTVVSNVWGPTFFNSRNAYSSIGFEQKHFNCASCKNSYLTDLPAEGDYVFDGDLFAKNIEFLKNHLSGSDRPIFNYVVGAYGHTPFRRNFNKRPSLYKNDILPPKLVNVINHYLYRLRAMEWYLEQLQEIDPGGIVVFFGDHLPNVTGKEMYQFHNYPDNGNHKMTETFIFYKGQHFRFNQIDQYQIPHIVGDILSGVYKCSPDKICRLDHIPRRISVDEYQRIIAGSIIKGLYE